MVIFRKIMIKGGMHMSYNCDSSIVKAVLPMLK